MLEDEIAWGPNLYVTAAGLALFGGGWTQAQLQGNSGGAYGVFVLNLYNFNGEPKQDMLGCPAPEGGMTIALFGMMLSGLGLLSRRIRA